MDKFSRHGDHSKLACHDRSGGVRATPDIGRKPTSIGHNRYKAIIARVRKGADADGQVDNHRGDETVM